MKNLLFVFILLLCSLSISAQYNRGNIHVAASVSTPYEMNGFDGDSYSFLPISDGSNVSTYIELTAYACLVQGERVSACVSAYLYGPGSWNKGFCVERRSPGVTRNQIEASPGVFSHMYASTSATITKAEGNCWATVDLTYW